MVLLSVTGSFAQDTMRMLIRPAKVRYLGLYVAPEYQYGQLNNTFTSLGGASAMLLFNKRFAIGVTAQHSLERRFSPAGVSPLYLNANYGGLKLEYTVNPNGAVHISFPLTIGMGFARADSLQSRQHTPGFEPGNRPFRGGDRYGVIQPGIHLEANLFRYAKLFAGASYRIAWENSSRTAVLPSNTLQGLSLEAGVKVGLFDWQLKRKQK